MGWFEKLFRPQQPTTLGLGGFDASPDPVQRPRPAASAAPQPGAPVRKSGQPDKGSCMKCGVKLEASLPAFGGPGLFPAEAERRAFAALRVARFECACGARMCFGCTPRSHSDIACDYCGAKMKELRMSV